MLQFYLSQILDEPSKCKFEQLYLNYRNTMLWVALSILHDQSLAEDAVHEAFMRILNNIENISLENCNKTRAYFVLIVRNIAIDLLRKRKQLAEFDLDDYQDYLPDYQTNPEETWLDKEGSQNILKALGKMKQTYVDVMNLHITYELSGQEIADLLNISPENVRIRMLRGKKQLAEYLKEINQNGV